VARRRKEAAAAAEAEESSGASRPARVPRATRVLGLVCTAVLLEWARHLYSNARAVVVCTPSTG